MQVNVRVACYALAKIALWALRKLRLSVNTLGAIPDG
jgi:hypothetical protein